MAALVSTPASAATQTFTWPDASITLTFGDLFGSCLLTNATLTNGGNKDLPSVYSQITVLRGTETINQVDVNFYPTAKGGTSKAASGTDERLGASPCSALTLHITA